MLKAFFIWLKAKTGRIVTAAGGLLALFDLDISPVKDTLESIVGHRGVQFVTLTLFVGSYLRHQYVATKIAPKQP
jgi:hypothetical protein